MNVSFDPGKLFPISFAPECGCNTSDPILQDQVATNIRRGLPQAKPHDINDNTALLVCGGPSLEQTQGELVAAAWRGGKVIAVNGAYQWCIEHNIKPSAMAMIDAREFNARFVETAVPECRYLLASQCHPRAFELCRGRDTIIWHLLSSEGEKKILDEYYFGKFFPVTMGVTIGLRAISLLRLLGFIRIEIFGLDSCWLEGRHHNYEQPENDKDGCLPVWLRSKGRDDLAQRFLCAPWHMKQFEDFQSVVKERGDLFELQVHGPGLIATALRTGATLDTTGD